MAIFSNQATLTVGGNSTSSNIVFGEILDVLAATKTAVEGTYTPGQTVTYVVTLRNTGNTALTGVTFTDDLGGYEFAGNTVYPLTYVSGSATLFIDGVPQAAPAITAGPPLVVSGFSIGAGSDAVIVYQAAANQFADPAAGGEIINTVTATANGITTPAIATETITGSTAPQLSISKAISPTQVTDNDRLTYTFVIQNSGNEEIIATDNAVITDTFDPALTDLTVTFNGAVWTQGVNYTYEPATGLFTTNPGQITVPAATYTQDPVTGAYTVNPGIATLAVTGTV